MARFSLSVLILMALAIPAKADEEVAPSPYVSASIEGRRYYFKMVPQPDAPYDVEKGMGYAYRVTNQKADALLWSTSGWYSFQTYLSGDGRYLVRLGNWPRGHEPSEKHLAIAFYKDGKKVKSYSTRQIIKDNSQVEASVSHYQFYQGEPGFTESYGYLFKLISVDNMEYVFDVRTGNIESTKKL